MPNLREIYLGGQTISDISPLKFCTNLTNIQIIKCPDITDISPLANCAEIWEFQSYDSGITDISILAELPKLTNLMLSGQVDLSPLGDMAALKSVLLFNLPFSSLEILKDKPALSELIIRGMQFESLEVIEQLNALQNLDISYTAVKDFSPLIGHAALKRFEMDSSMEQYIPGLDRKDIQVFVETQEGKKFVFNEVLIEKAVRLNLGLNDNQIITEDALATVRELYIINSEIFPSWESYMNYIGWEGHHCAKDGYGQNEISSLADLSAMKSLTKLAVISQNISNVAPLSDLPLEYLALCNNPIWEADLAPLKNCPRLRALYLDGTNLSDLSELSDFSLIRALSIRDTKVTSLQPLEGMQIESLILPTGIEDISPLSTLPLKELNLRAYPDAIDFICSLSGLETLHYGESSIDRLEPFTRLKNLKKLILFGNRLTNLEGVQLIPGLRQLTISGINNPPADISAISNHPTLESLKIDGCPINDLSPLFELPKLHLLVIDSKQEISLKTIDPSPSFKVDIRN